MYTLAFMWEFTRGSFSAIGLSVGTSKLVEAKQSALSADKSVLTRLSSNLLNYHLLMQISNMTNTDLFNDLHF